MHPAWRKCLATSANNAWPHDYPDYRSRPRCNALPHKQSQFNRPFLSDTKSIYPLDDNQKGCSQCSLLESSYYRPGLHHPGRRWWFYTPAKLGRWKITNFRDFVRWQSDYLFPTVHGFRKLDLFLCLKIHINFTTANKLKDTEWLKQNNIVREKSPGPIRLQRLNESFVETIHVKPFSRHPDTVWLSLSRICCRQTPKQDFKFQFGGKEILFRTRTCSNLRKRVCNNMRWHHPVIKSNTKHILLDTSLFSAFTYDPARCIYIIMGQRLY